MQYIVGQAQARFSADRQWSRQLYDIIGGVDLEERGFNHEEVVAKLEEYSLLPEDFKARYFKEGALDHKKAHSLLELLWYRIHQEDSQLSQAGLNEYEAGESVNAFGQKIHFIPVPVERRGEFIQGLKTGRQPAGLAGYEVC